MGKLLSLIQVREGLLKEVYRKKLENDKYEKIVGWAAFGGTPAPDGVYILDYTLKRLVCDVLAGAPEPPGGAGHLAMIMVEQDSLKEARKKGKDTEQYYQELHEESRRIPDSEPPFWEAFECGLCNIKGRGCPNPEKAK